jgi:hypothetical protein
VLPYDFEETVTLTGDPSQPYLARDWRDLDCWAPD